jgi:hypothetical protein
MYYNMTVKPQMSDRFILGHLVTACEEHATYLANTASYLDEKHASLARTALVCEVWRRVCLFDLDAEMYLRRNPSWMGGRARPG